jgi:hypothetical protein
MGERGIFMFSWTRSIFTWIDSKSLKELAIESMAEKRKKFRAIERREILCLRAERYVNHEGQSLRLAGPWRKVSRPRVTTKES